MKLVHLKILIFKDEGEAIKCRAGVRGVKRWDGRRREGCDPGVKYRHCVWIRATRDPEGKR